MVSMNTRPTKLLNLSSEYKYRHITVNIVLYCLRFYEVNITSIVVTFYIDAR